MANLSVSLSNLLKSLNYQYAAASKKNAESKTTTASTSGANTAATTANKTVSSNSNTSTAKTTSTSATSSSLAKLLGNLTKATSVLNNTSVITNDMVTEFFKSYKNATMT